MKRLAIVFALITIYTVSACGQAAPLGKDLIKSFSERMQSYQSIHANFDFTIENLAEEFSDTHKGKFSFKGKKYFLELMGMEVYFDGETKWQFIPEVNEVTISYPSSLDGGFLDDPTQIFRDYEKDFKSRFMGEKIERGVSYYEVDLYPENLSEPYSIIKITFRKDSLDPVSIRYQGKDGVNYIIKVSGFKTDLAMSDQQFIFDPSKHADIEIVDLR